MVVGVRTAAVFGLLGSLRRFVFMAVFPYC